MKALTIRQPWAHAILDLDKDVENRSWPTKHLGPMLIHAGLYYERSPREQLAEYMRRPPTMKSLSHLPLGCIVGVVEVVGCVKNSRSRWAEKGSWHWQIKKPRSIKPVKCKGRLGLWTPRHAVMKKLPAWVRKLEKK